jgi:hypothetical protein
MLAEQEVILMAQRAAVQRADQQKSSQLLPQPLADSHLSMAKGQAISSARPSQQGQQTKTVQGESRSGCLEKTSPAPLHCQEPLFQYCQSDPHEKQLAVISTRKSLRQNRQQMLSQLRRENIL